MLMTPTYFSSTATITPTARAFLPVHARFKVILCDPVTSQFVVELFGPCPGEEWSLPVLPRVSLTLVKFRVYVVRHGETDWNRTRKLQGQVDVSLNETGFKQSMLVGEALKDVLFIRAFSSDLQRALQTAECILQYHPDVALEKDESIRERYYGDELQGEIPGRDEPTLSTETIPEFSARCLAWYTRSIENYMTATVKGRGPAEQPSNILVVSHGGWVLTLLTTLREKGAIVCHEGVTIGYCLNTGVSIVEYADIPGEGEKPLVGTLVQYSSVEHLTCNNLTPLEVNADVLGDEWWRP